MVPQKEGRKGEKCDASFQAEMGTLKGERDLCSFSFLGLHAMSRDSVCQGGPHDPGPT